MPVADYNSHEDDLWNVNYPSVYIADPAPNALTVQRTAKSLLAVDSVWKLTVIQDPTPGLTVTAPATLTVPANGSASLNIGINKTGIPANETRHAMLHLKYKSFLLQMPIGAAGPVARPDLIVTAVATPAGGTRGSGMFISTTVGNQGTLTATGFQIQFYLSQNDATLGASDRSYGSCNVTSLAVNAAFTCQGTLTIPSDISPGTYSLIVKVDDEEAVVESIENNNTRASSSSFTIN